jgi:hypothetical protein
MILNFRLWLLRENFAPAAYDALFNKELDAVWPTIRNADDRNRLAAMRGGWTNYIAACLRNSGVRDQGDLEEKIHDIVVKLLVSPGGLIRAYDADRHGPLDLRFKRSVSNAVKNIVEKENTRKRFLRPAPHADFVPGSDELPARPEKDHDERIIDGFRTFLQTDLGDLAVKIFDARLDGREMADLVLPNLDRPSRYRVKQVVQQVKLAAREYARQLHNPDFLRRVDRMMDAEAATVARRLSTTQQRRAGAART